MQKIKTSQHNLIPLNSNKKSKLILFLAEYRIATQFYIDYLWNNKIIINDKILDIKNDLLDCPQFISTTNLNLNTSLSKRTLKAASTQACRSY